MNLAPSTNPPVILIAGGGSGGHISPGLAIAERLAELDPNARVTFACSRRAIDAKMLGNAGAAFTPIDAAPFSMRPGALWRFAAAFSRGRKAAAGIILRDNVTHVVTMGGFVAAPVVAAARQRGIPITLINLDSPPGKANRWMARRCDRVLSAVPVAHDPLFREQIAGVPIRRCAIAPGDRDQQQCRRELGLDPAKQTLLVTGASQGARTINRLIPLLARREPQAFAAWQIYHLSGEGDDDSVRDTYAQAGVNAVVEPFTNRMGLAWGSAALAVSRAGANSVAEVAANAVPTLFLPYPFHRDRHQFHNAQPLVDLGGAVVTEDLIDDEANARTIGPALRALLNDARRREAMRQALRVLAPPDAALQVARILLGLSSPPR